MLRSLFFSPTEPRLRAGWRLLIHWLVMLGLIIVLTIPIIIIYLSGVPDTVAFLSNQVALFIAINTTVPLARRLLDRRSFASLGLSLRGALPDLLGGFIIAGVMMNAIFVVEQLLGWARIESVAWQSANRVEVVIQLGFWLVLFIIVGWQEELLARGYWLQNIADGTNLPIAFSLSSLMFAALHLSNPNVSVLAIVGLIGAGLFLASGYVFTRQLWLPIGLHVGWNFFEGNIFGFRVSGLDTFRLITLRVHGPELWTGGAFGPEAGLIVFPAMLLGIGLMYGYSRLRLFLFPKE